MECLVCQGKGKEIFKGRILKKYETCYYQCPECGLIYTEEPYWIKEAYDDAITIYDTGIMTRNISLSIATYTILKSLFGNRNVRGLDWGGGYGIFVRLMRDLGYSFSWFDKYSANLVSRGFEADIKLDERYDIITAFEVLEHLPDPLQEIEKMLNKSNIILFSTVVYDKKMNYPQLDDWWYYVPEEGQHIVFYSNMTLKKIAKKFNINYYSINSSLHIFSKKKIRFHYIKCMMNCKAGSVISLLKWEAARCKNQGAMRDMEMLLDQKSST